MKIKRALKYMLCAYIIIMGLIGYNLLKTDKECGTAEGLTESNVEASNLSRTTFSQTATTQLSSPKRSDELVKLPNQTIFLYTALLSNSSSDQVWDRLAITGWEHKDLKNKHLVCCVKFKSGIIRQTPIATRVRNVLYEAKLGPLQSVCDLLGRYNSSDPPCSATISLKFGHKETTGNCLVEDSTYILIEYVHSHPKEIAAIAKIIYGNVFIPDLVAWLEIHRSLGMDKVVFYSYRLGHNVSTVLQYYQKKGLVEVIPISFPNQEYKTADFSSLILTYDYWVDEEMALIDGQERLRGYEYVVVFDIDEYIVPNGQGTWVNLTEELFRSQPKIAGVKFLTRLYTTSWGVSSNDSTLQIGRYFQRTGGTHDRPKYVFIPSKVKEAGFHPHNFASKPGFHVSSVPENLATLSHYRSCRERYDLTSTKCFGFQRHVDDSIYRRFSYMEDNVKRLIKQII